MESTHLLGTGSRKRVKIHPHAVTAQYSAPPPFPPPRPPAAAPLPLPRPGDEGYDEAPSFEDFGSFLDETSDRRRLTGGRGRRWAGPTLFGGGGGKEGSRDTPLKASPAGAEEEGGVRGFGGGGGGGGGGVGEQLASFGEASASASRLTWAGLLASALASGIVAVLTRLASDRFGLGPLFLLLVRSALQLSSLAVPLRRGEPAFGPPGHRLRLALYGAAYSLSLCCAYASLAFVSPDDAAVTWRLATTALSATLAFLLLDERLGLADGAAAAAGGVCGLGLALVPDMGVAGDTGGGVASPEEASARFWRSAFGWSLSAMAGLWMALALVGYRSMKERVGVAAALFAVSWTGCLAAAASMALLREGAAWPSGAPAWLLLLGLAACTAAAFLGVTHALARIHPALVSASQSAEVPAAALLQMAVLPAATAPSAWALAGGAVVTASVGWLLAVKLRPSRGGGAGRRQREEYEEILDSPVK